MSLVKLTIYSKSITYLTVDIYYSVVAKIGVLGRTVPYNIVNSVQSIAAVLIGVYNQGR